MKRYLLLIALLTLFPTAYQVEAVLANEVNPTEVVEEELEPEIKAYAKAISVKIANQDKNRGSGVIIGKQGNEYLVVTNNHVIRNAESLSIQTEDGISHQGKLVENSIATDDDIALLVFESSNEYQPVRLNPKGANTAKEEKAIYAVGYAAQTEEFTIATGNIERVNQKLFQEGYQIGYSSNVVEGMSGGAIFDNSGDLVGINGIGAFPILDTAYQYEDGTTPSATEIEQFRPLSWGLSLHRLLTQLNPEIITAYNLPQPETAADVPQTELTGWLGELETKAKQITVRIDSSSGANGSGIIVAKEGNKYTVLTVNHVLCEKDEEAKAVDECIDHSYTIVTPDGEKYPLDPQTINAQPGVDLATFQFTSPETYQVAQFADYPLQDDDAVFVAGFPKLSEDNPAQWAFSLGYGFDREQGLFEVEVNVNSNSTNVESTTSASSQSINAYEMVYTTITYGGMSGGAVLDREGRVIGIHGLAEVETTFSSQGGKEQEDKIQLGYSLGIPSQTFIGLQDQLGINPRLSPQSSPPVALNSQERDTFTTAILGTEIPSGNTTAKRLLERGNQLWRLQRHKEAVTMFDRAIALKPEFIHLAYYGKGLALLYLGENESALASLERANTIQPSFAPAFEYKSLILKNLNQLDASLLAINKAITLQPNNANSHSQKGGILLELKRYSEAEAAYTEAISIDSRPAFYNNRGILYREQGEIELALSDYSQAIEINPNLAQAYYNRGVFYYEQGEVELALSDYSQAIEINPNYAQAYGNRGILHSDQGEVELALANYNQAIEINPNDAQAYGNRGVFYYEQGEVELALSDYSQAIEINPNYAQAYGNRGVLYHDQGEVELALSNYNQAIEINPNLAQAYYSRGILYREQGEIELALNDYNQAIEINPNLAQAYGNRGNLHSDQGEVELALNDYNQAIEINPNDAQAYGNRGVLYDDQGEVELALANYNQAIEINPNYAIAYYNRGLLYDDQGEVELALANYNQAIEINPNLAQAYYNRGLLYQNQGEVELALNDYNQAIEFNPNFAQAYGNLGLLHHQLGNKTATIANMKKARDLFIVQNNTKGAEQAANFLKEIE